MSRAFDPNFQFNFNYDGDLNDLIAMFCKEVKSLITVWQGGLGQTKDCYIDFHSDVAYKHGLSKYQYVLFIAGKLDICNDEEQIHQVNFAISVRDFLDKHHCDHQFSAFFSLESNS